MDRCIELGVSKEQTMLMDSGAFTAWSLGHPMTLDKLLPIYEHIQDKYAPHFKEIWYINLDVIPGSRQQAPTEEQLAQALIDSDVNYHRLEDSVGRYILPVFHQGEPWERLEECISMSPNYICVSPRQTVSEGHRIAWLQQVELRRPHGLRMHGLATTGARSIRACDWFSVDSASWVIIGGLGGVLIPDGSGWIRSLNVSNVSPALKDADKHYLTMPEAKQRELDKIFTSYGMQYPWLADSHEYRKVFNLLVTSDAAEHVKPQPILQEGLF